MNQPKKAFNEVRAILGKLDRSREELRAKPAQPEPARQAAPSNHVPALPTPSQAPAIARPGVPAATQAVPTRPAPAPPTPGSKYGRAQPIRPSNDALGRWNPPGQ